MRLHIVLITALLVSGAAAAQSGPQPGYDSAMEYAQDYATAKADDAAADPVGFGADHASQAALENETAHAAYMACWAADDHDVQHDACDPYYVPRGEAQPEQPEEPMVTDPAMNATDAFVAEVQDVAEQIVGDPTSAPDQVERVVDATLTFLGHIIATVEDLADGLIAGLEDLIGLGDSIGAGIESVGLGTAGGLATGATTVADGSAAAATAAADAVVTSVAALSDGVAAAAGAVASGLASAAGAVGDGLAASVAAVGHGLQTAGEAIATAAVTVADAIGDGLAAIGDSLRGALGQEPVQPANDDALPSLELPEGGLLDRISPIGQ